jgi:hypothetical protein
VRTGFKTLPQFNGPTRVDVSSRRRLDERLLDWFPSDGLPDRFARALARERAVPVKELFESFEFFGRVRKLVRAPVVVDLCAGHGLTGVLFALFERSVERVVLVDRRRPGSFDRVVAAAAGVGPWAAGKLEYRVERLARAGEGLDAGAAVVAVHACGQRTDRCLDVALALRGPVAVMPCCYSDARCPAPAALAEHLPGGLAHDVDRTYRLEAAGYRVRWDAVPGEVTPMSRIVIGVPR